MNKIAAFLSTAIILLIISLTFTVQSKAQTKSFAGLVPFMTNTERLGLLDQTTGRIYVYDTNFTDCLYIGQIHQLGKEIEVIRKAN